jgi:outer membrane protein
MAAMPLASRGATLTFDECLALAAQNNGALRNAQASVASAEQRERAAYSGFFTQVSGDVNYVDRSGSAGATAVDTTGYSTSVTVTQNLFAGFQDQARVEQGAADLDLAQAALASAKAQLSRDLKTAFAGLAYAQDNVALTQNILQRFEGNLRLVPGAARIRAQSDRGAALRVISKVRRVKG